MIENHHRILSWIRISTPALFSCLLVTISAVNFHIPGMTNFVPLVALMSIFYWGIYWPALIPAWFVFLLGIYQDFLYGTDIGINSFVNLLLLWLVVVQRKYLVKEAFWIVWSVFSFVMLIFALMIGAIYSFYYNEFLMSDNVLMQWMISAFLYPFLHKLFNVVHVAFLEA